MRNRKSLRQPLLIALASVLAIAGCGASRSADGRAVTASTSTRRVRPTVNRVEDKRATVYETMFDIGYRPNRALTFARGTTVRFVFHNTGSVHHEAVLGDGPDQLAHDRAMNESGSHEMPDAPELDVAPGETKVLVSTFEHTGRLYIGCHYPGHYAAGVRIPITITESRRRP